MSAAYRRPHARIGTILFYLPFIWAGLVNRTIDDDFGDSVTGEKPTYSPSFSFTRKGCFGCSTTPHFDPSQTFRGTWHESILRTDAGTRTITVNFTGTAVYLYNALSTRSSSDRTHLEFQLDGAYVGTFLADTGFAGNAYRVPVYVNRSIPGSAHTLLIRLAQNSSCLFDYVEYTTSDDAPTVPPGASASTATATAHLFAASAVVDTTAPQLSPTEITGVTIGGAAAALTTLMLLRAVRRRRGRLASEGRSRSFLLPTPYALPPAIPPPSERGASPDSIGIEEDTGTRADAPPLTTGAPGAQVASEEEEEAATVRIQGARVAEEEEGPATVRIQEEQAWLRAQLALLQERVERMQEVMELPPEYASDAGRGGAGP